VDSRASLTGQDLIPLLSDILSDPFSTVYPPLIGVTIQTLQTIILTNWPRIAVHRAEVLRGLTLCWLTLTEDEPKAQNLHKMKQGVRDAVELLKAAVRSEVDIDADIKLLIQSDVRLDKLFNL
jgi:tRNA nucleotidyltransferase (CCA-adding enzyme)